VHGADVVQHVLIAHDQARDHHKEIEAKKHFKDSVKTEVFFNPEKRKITWRDKRAQQYVLPPAKYI